MSGVKNGEDIVDSICESLSLAIAEGALGPGTKIHEDIIAKHFGVSRTVVRGAVGILEHEKVIERRRNHGAFVATPDKTQAAHLLEARRAVELAIAARAVNSLTDDQLEQLETLTRSEDAIHGGSDKAAKKRLSGNFHVELATAAGNTVFADILKNLIARLSLVSAIYERGAPNKCGANDHREIIEAIRRRDADAARAATLRHLEHLESELDLTAPQDDETSLSSVLAKFAPDGKLVGKRT